MAEIKVSKFKLLALITALSFNAPVTNAFDGTDASAPKIISIRQLTTVPTTTSELIVIEVVTQDDKNWVRITGTPQIGYSYQISNPNAAPNCATVSNSFSKLELVEDEAFRKTDQSGQKNQRFLLVGYAPKPKELPASCPEYRNLSAQPAVALNTNTFLTSINKTTKVKTNLSNLVTPTLQDESGRTTASATIGNLSANNLALTNPSVGNSSQFCVSQSLLPKNNATVASIQAKYIEMKALALNLQVVLQENPIINSYEAQVAIWMNLNTNLSIENINKLGSCYVPITSQQIVAAFQDSIKLAQTNLAAIQKAQVSKDCEDTNLIIGKILDFRNLISRETSLFIKYKDFITQSKSIRVLDCSKVSSKQLIDAQASAKLPAEFVTSNITLGLQTFCEARNSKRAQFLDLTAKMAFRYQNTLDVKSWKNNPELLTFQMCTSETQPKDLITISDNTNKMILQVNTLLAKLQGLERKKSLSINIKCKNGKKSVIKSGKSPTCPSGYVEEKIEFKKIV